MSGVLEGIRVLDLGRVLAAPSTGAIFGDMGAEVIKLEEPTRGDDSRGFAPMKNGVSCYYKNFNRSKKGITLDLKTGKDVFLELVKNVDVVIENFRPGTMDKLGLGYEELKKVNPGLIYGAVSGFGATGPYKFRAGYDTMAQAYGGVMSITGWPESDPVRCGASIGDIIGGMNLMIGVLAALRYRDKTGIGQMIDISLTDSCVVAEASMIQVYLTTGKVPTKNGNSYTSSAPGGGYRTKDGYCVINGSAPKFWIMLCDLLGMPELKDDPRFATNALRVKNRVELDKIVGAWVMTMTTEEVLELLLPKGFACAPILTLDQVVANEHIGGARNMFPEIDDPEVGKMRFTNTAIKMSETMPEIRCPAPTLGQHNQETYSSILGYSKEKIDQLKEAGII
ncbi:MAG: CaiB/BaiF CoA-transferase family protein [Eubacteriales bacterium]|nr:CaiB/BaiF CoA-transferase family protein [Eubacteriales bacterium]